MKLFIIQTANGKKVRPGMMVEVLPSTIKRQEHGYLVARITAVSEVPATQEGMMRVLKNRQLAQSLSEGGAPFEVRAELVPNAKTPTGLQWSSSRGPETTISNGTLCKAEIVTRTDDGLHRYTYGEWGKRAIQLAHALQNVQSAAEFLLKTLYYLCGAIG